MKKLFSTLILFVLMLCITLAFTACGGSESNGGDDTSDTEDCKHNDENKDGICDKCDKDISTNDPVEPDIPAHTHSLVKNDRVEPTCDKDGSIDYWSCECGKYFSDAEGTNEISISNTVIVAKHSLVYQEETSASCTENGNIGHYACSVCKKTYSDINATNELETAVIPAGHKFEDNECIICNAPRVTEGLKYALNSDNSSYSVAGIGTATDKDIIIPSTYKDLPVTSIGDNAFNYCASITSINIPDSVISIGYAAFYDCTSLASVTIPKNVKTINSSAFDSCTRLTKINFNATNINDLESGAYIFSGAGTNENGIKVTIGKNVTKIPATLFYSYKSPAKIVSVEFEEGSICESIGDNAFANCPALISVNIPDSVISIGYAAFYDCTSLASVTIPKNVTSIGESAFQNCKSLTAINFDAVSMNDFSNARSPFVFAGQNGEGIKVTFGKYVADIPNSLFYCGSDIYSPKIISVEFEEGSVCKTIGNDAFSNSVNLKSITIPEYLTSIGDNAFYNCSSLTEIKFNATDMDDLTPPNGIFYDAGENGEGIKVTIGKNVTKIPANLFFTYNSSFPKIISVEFEEGSFCDSIGENAFCYSENIISITIPDSVTSIGASAFSNCTSLISIIIENMSTWYRTTSLSDWQNQTGGTETDVSDSSINATYFKDTYSSYYWYTN